MENIPVEELNPGVILEGKKRNCKTYQYSIPQYAPGSGGQGYTAEIGYMPQYTPGTGGKGYVTALIPGTSGERRGGSDNA